MQFHSAADQLPSPSYEVPGKDSLSESEQSLIKLVGEKYTSALRYAIMKELMTREMKIKFAQSIMQGGTKEYLQMLLPVYRNQIIHMQQLVKNPETVENWLLKIVIY